MSFLSRIVQNYTDARDRKSFSYLYTAIIGLGFFTTAITWSMYNVYVPIFLRDLIGYLDNSKLIIGIIMVIDNIAAITLQPWLGKVSDNIWTKFGRRMPFIMIGIPIAALFFGLIPTVMETLWLLILIIGGFNISMALYRAPVVALMPDLVSKEYRSRGNAVINLLGGVGSLIGLFVMAAIYKINPTLSFWIVSIVMILCLVTLYFNIREPKERVDVEVKEKVSLIDSIRNMFMDKDKSLIFILFAILSWFFAFNAIETWFSTYATDPNLLGITNEADASMLLGVYSLTFIIFAIPAGLIAKKIGRKKTMMIGLIGLVTIMIPLVIFSLVDISALRTYIFYTIPIPFWWTWEVLIDGILLFLGGMFWAFININSIVVVWELAGTARLGTYTGLYYFFSATAAILSPVVAGAIFDATNISALFLYSFIFFVLALVLTIFIRRTGNEADEQTLAK